MIVGPTQRPPNRPRRQTRMSMTRSATGIIILLVLASCACGDVVYTRDGLTYEGKVSRRDGKVVVQMEDKTIELLDDQVLHISTQQVATQPAATQPSDVTTQPSLGRWQFPLRHVRQPEVIVFSLMRSLAARPGGPARLAVRQYLRRWQIAAHDRKRSIGQRRWVAPREFIRRRQVFQRHLAEAEELYKQIKQQSAKPKGKDKPDTTAAQAKAHAKLWGAAGIWADPLLRDFLMALAWLEANNLPSAQKQFARCRTEAPHVAAFHQGYGMILLELNQPLKALEALTQALRLKPDAPAAVSLALQAAKRIPGSQTHNPIYIEAATLLRDHAATRPKKPRAGGIQWLMPGKPWRATSGTLPTPPYDRLVFTQAVAVPVGPSALLVDAEAVADALEIYVRIDDRTLVPAMLRRRSRRIGRSDTTVPLTLLTLGNYIFTPVEIAPPDTLERDQTVTAYGLGRFEEMGTTVRTINAQITTAGEGALSLTGGLIAGESAAPIFTDSGMLVGFLAAKADAEADGGGPDRLIGADDLEDLLKQARKRSSSLRRSRTKKLTKPKQAEGQTFIVHVISPEILD